MLLDYLDFDGDSMKIAVNTGGGDAPGLNAVIRAVTLSAHARGWDVWGLRYGYRSLVDESTPMVALTPERVSEITKLGGTILGAINRGNPFEYPVEIEAGSFEARDLSETVVERFHSNGFDALVAIGGDGSMSIAHRLGEKGMKIVGVPKTIDNDLEGTWASFGFDTAVANATEIIDKLHTTAKSHERVMVVEVMGRDAGWIALHAGTAGDADVILMPEIPFSYKRIFEKIQSLFGPGKKNYGVVVVSEAARAKERRTVLLSPREIGRARRLGGIGTQVAEEITAHTKQETRVMVLGHVQRGGEPTNFDRILAMRFGSAAVRTIEAGQFGTYVSFQPPEIVPRPLSDAYGRIRTVPLTHDLVTTARELGICLGD